MDSLRSTRNFFQYFRAFFHGQNLYYYEASTALVLALALFSTGERKEMLMHVQRALDLAARFDYEYWLREEVKKNPALFSDEEIREKLPLDLRESIEKSCESNAESPKAETITESRESKIKTISVLDSPHSNAPVVDLTLKLLGHVEIYRDPSKPFATDAWTTRRARDIFCFITTSRHRRVEKDTLIDAFWGDAELKVIEKNFHPPISLLRKALLCLP